MRLSKETIQNPRAQIVVAPAVRVSQANFSRVHWEVQIAADPTNAQRLIACSKLLSGDLMNNEGAYMRAWPENVIVYTSMDSGLSWQPTLELDNHQHNTDPSCVFGPDGSAYFMSFGGNVLSKLRMPMYRSVDGGKTWNAIGEADALDREYVTIDDTTGKYRGRVYVHGIMGMAGIDGAHISGLGVFRSTDQGKTYKSVKLPNEGSQWVIGNANGVVMSDGTFGTIFEDLLNEKEASMVQELHPTAPNGKIKFISSSDGGETFGKATVVSDSYERGMLLLTGQPTLAVDRTEGPFHDRLYAAWVDARSGRGEIRFARSHDKGKSWFPSFVISDNWPHDELGETPDAFMPMLAVNRDGVLGVMWYDRRDHRDNLGYDIRFSASVDGGESFLPSVRVSPGGASALQMKEWLLWPPWQGHLSAKPDGRQHAAIGAWLYWWSDNGGDTAGLACDVDGIFHPLWIDRRSGIQQVSTTRITVNGVAMPNGGAGLESLRDLSAKAEVRYSVAHVDLATNVISIGAAITNTSKEPIPGQLTLRLLTLSSSNGLIEAQNADNGLTTGGAVWEFRTASGESLGPGALTVPRQLRFKLAHAPFAPPRLPPRWQPELLELDTKIIGK